ncbi:hypothetical protein SprV_0100258300 [Sparganum proliferum]
MVRLSGGGGEWCSQGEWSPYLMDGDGKRASTVKGCFRIPTSLFRPAYSAHARSLEPVPWGEAFCHNDDDENGDDGRGGGGGGVRCRRRSCHHRPGRRGRPPPPPPPPHFLPRRVEVVDQKRCGVAACPALLTSYLSSAYHQVVRTNEVVKKQTVAKPQHKACEGSLTCLLGPYQTLRYPYHPPKRNRPHTIVRPPNPTRTTTEWVDSGEMLMNVIKVRATCTMSTVLCLLPLQVEPPPSLVRSPDHSRC